MRGRLSACGQAQADRPGKNRRCIRRNALSVFSGRARCRWLRIVRRNRTVNVRQAPKTKTFGSVMHTQKKERMVYAYLNH